MTNETPDQKLSRLTGTTLSQSTIPKADLLMEGDGNIVISWYGKTNLLNDRYALITDFGTATPPIYITDPVKEGVVLSARSAIEDYSARCMFDISVAVLHLDYVVTYDTIDLILVCTKVFKQIHHLYQSFKDKHGQFFIIILKTCFTSTCP